MKTYMRQFHIPWRQIENKAVLISIKDNEVVVLNEMGTEVWKFLSDEKTEEDISTYILSLYDSNEDTVRRDVAHFLSDLEKKGLLNVAENP